MFRLFWAFLPVFVYFSQLVDYTIHVFIFSAFAVVFALRVDGVGFSSGAAVGVAYGALLFALGVVYGFVESPYGGSLDGAVFNFVYFSTFVVAKEFARFLALSASRRRWWPFVVSIMFAFELYRPVFSPQWVGGVAVPAMALSLSATYLQLRHGAFASLPLAFASGVVPFVLPAAPQVPWIVLGLVHIFLFLAVAADVGEIASRRDLLFALALVGIVAFAVGGFGVKPYVVVTGSMSPAIERGDVVIVGPVNPGEVKVGDVVAYRGEGVVVHRVVAVDRGDDGRLVFTMKGDANDSPDPPVPEEALMGKVVYVVPKVGLPVLWARNPADWPLLAGLLLGVFLLENGARRVFRFIYRRFFTL